MSAFARSVMEKDGFSLVELIVVITIIAILATIGFLAYSGYSEDASAATVRTNLRTTLSATNSESEFRVQSPRYSIIYVTGATLGWGTAYGTGLVAGVYGTPNTNYSAGKVSFYNAGISPRHFSNSDGTDFLMAAMDLEETSANGKKRINAVMQVAGYGNGKVWMVEGTYPGAGAAGIWSVEGLIRNPTSTGTGTPITEGTRAF